LVAEQLVGSATATLTLDKFDFGPQFGVAWRYDGIEYELEPIPEPTTLLLFGTTIAGLGFAARRRRQRRK
jgi:PEP-CTERM motif